MVTADPLIFHAPLSIEINCCLKLPYAIRNAAAPINKNKQAEPMKDFLSICNMNTNYKYQPDLHITKLVLLNKPVFRALKITTALVS